jgi:predicted MFS family arabinose efflux permease
MGSVAQKSGGENGTSMSKLRSWLTIFDGTFIVAISMGTMWTIGLYVAPIQHETGLSLSLISLAIATLQIVSGVMQSVFGVLSDSRGTAPVLVAGALLIAAGFVVTSFVGHTGALVVTLGLICATGWGACAYSIVSGSVARQLNPKRRSFAFGVLNSGTSTGQLIFAPLVTIFIAVLGWAGAMQAAAAISLLIIPCALLFRGTAKPVTQRTAIWDIKGDLAQQVRAAYHDRNFLLLSAAFVTCGFHVSFLAAHYPNDIDMHGHGLAVSGTAVSIIGICNIVGCLVAGILGSRIRLKVILVFLYAARAVIIVGFLLSDKSPGAFYLAAAAIGITWTATVGPTNGLIDKYFGPRFLSTLMGLTMLAHQVGAFLGAWLGGLIVTATGSYQNMFILDIALTSAATLAMIYVKEPAPAAVTNMRDRIASVMCEREICVGASRCLSAWLAFIYSRPIG